MCKNASGNLHTINLKIDFQLECRDMKDGGLRDGTNDLMQTRSRNTNGSPSKSFRESEAELRLEREAASSPAENWTAFAVWRALGFLFDEFMRSAKGPPSSEASAEGEAKMSGGTRRLRQDGGDERSDKVDV